MNKDKGRNTEGKLAKSPKGKLMSEIFIPLLVCQDSRTS